MKPEPSMRRGKTKHTVPCSPHLWDKGMFFSIQTQGKSRQCPNPAYVPGSPKHQCETCSWRSKGSGMDSSMCSQHILGASVKRDVRKVMSRLGPCLLTSRTCIVGTRGEQQRP